MFSVWKNCTRRVKVWSLYVDIFPVHALHKEFIRHLIDEERQRPLSIITNPVNWRSSRDCSISRHTRLVWRISKASESKRKSHGNQINNKKGRAEFYIDVRAGAISMPDLSLIYGWCDWLHFHRLNLPLNGSLISPCWAIQATNVAALACNRPSHPK